MQEILNIHETAGMLNKSVVYRTFPEVLKDVQENPTSENIWNRATWA